MYVISGKLKGRKIDGYNILGTRPTMARVKESLFATIQNNTLDALVLDLFSGSGNYGIEAYSNGAKFVYFNDLNKVCCKVIKQNIQRLGIENYCKIDCLDYKEYLNYYSKTNIKYDLVFLDPPYKMNVCNDILTFLDNNLLNDKALVICEVNNNNLKNEYKHLTLLKIKKYGEKYIFIYKNKL